MGAEALWPVVAGAVVLAIVVMVFRNVRKRGRAEAERDHEEEEGERNAEADEIMAEARVDAGTWSDGLHDSADGD